MKAKNYLWHIVQGCTFAVLMMVVVCCSGDDDPLDPTPKPDPSPKDNGQVTFVVNNEGGGTGSGSSSSPAVVAQGDTLNMTISQKSSYIEPDGSVFTCEPKAVIQLNSKLDTVRVKDKNLLTDVKEKAEVTTSQSGEKPVRNAIAQKFQIGEDQFINFDLAYEVYKHVNKANQTIEMPYVKLYEAAFGSSSSAENEKTRATEDEETEKTEEPKVILKPVEVLTRALVKDTTMYEVTAKFELDIESVNAKETNKQTLSFDVMYIGVVETTTEVPDPEGKIDFTVSVEGGSGDGSSSSPATAIGTEPLNVTIGQKSIYTDIDGSVFKCEPKASIKLYSALDTVYVSDKSLLTSVNSKPEVSTSQSGEDPIVNAITQKFKVGNEQYINFDLAYEVIKHLNKSNETVEMPYVKLNEAAFADAGTAETRSSSWNVGTPWGNSIKANITLKPIDVQTRAIISTTDMYEVTAKFELEIESVNAKEASKQTLSLDVKYIGVVETTTEVPDPEGKVDFNVSIDGGNGDGSSSSPATANGTEPLDLTISQKSIYTDIDGSVFECEPKATIKLYSALDTVYVSDKSLLTSVSSKPEVSTSQNGKEPIVNAITQKFKVGNAQYINFDLAYEVFKHINKSNETIEMPYIKVNEATFADAGTTTRSNALGAETPWGNSIKANIVLKPIDVQTRAIISTTDMYEVTAKFELEIESVNAKEAGKQTLSLDIKYIGVVETTTEIPDPEGKVDFDVNINGGIGDGSSSSPATAKGAEPLDLTISQKSIYTDIDGSVFECEPKATIKLYSALDTVRVTDKSLLTSVNSAPEKSTSQNGKDPVVNAITQKFKVGNEQYINFDLAYEVFNHVNKSNETIEMPYIKVKEAAFANAGTATRSFGASPVSLRPIYVATRALETTTEMYEVLVRFNLDVEAVNSKEPMTQTFTLDAIYIGVVETTTEVPDDKKEVVSIDYRRDWRWDEAHHNLPLLLYPMVHRDTHYSDGTTETETLVDYGHAPLLSSHTSTGLDTSHSEIVEWIDGSGEVHKDSILYSSYDITYNDSVYIFKETAVIPFDISGVTTEEVSDGYTDTRPGEWNKYTPSKLYKNEQASISNINNLWDFAATDWESSSAQDGWYIAGIFERQYLMIRYNDKLISTLFLIPNFTDQFLSIDGMRIDFLDYLPQHDFNLIVEDIPASGSYGPGKKFTYECKTKFYGRNFYIAVEETVYERKK